LRDSHLHQFEQECKYWGAPETEEFGDLELKDESKVPVGKLLKVEGDSMVYVYDFGDDWRHEVVLEEILPSETRTKPVCLAGERRCPPEDVGGPHGYRGWAGGKFHAEEFNLKEVNEILDRMRWPVNHGR